MLGAFQVRDELAEERAASEQWQARADTSRRDGADARDCHR